MTTPLSDAVAAMAQVIDAQARHIAKLEAGHWSQETRAEVTAARTILDQITEREAPDTQPTANDQHLRESIAQHRGTTGTPYGPQPYTHMFDRGGDLHTGLVEVTNTSGKPMPVDGLADFEPRRCTVRHGSNGDLQCTRERGHLWPHAWDTPPQDKTE